MGKGHRSQVPAGLRRRDQRCERILASSHLGFAPVHHAGGLRLDPRLRHGRQLASVRWGTAGQIALGWLFTLPAAALVGAAAAWLAGTGPVGTIVVAVVLIAGRSGHLRPWCRRPITAQQPANDVPAPVLVMAAA